MYYNRTISDEFETLLKTGCLDWIIPYVKEHEDLDVLIGCNKGMEFCSIYRGLSRILRISRTISQTKSGEKKYGDFKWDAAKAYKKLYSDPNVSWKQLRKDDIDKVRSQVDDNPYFCKYYRKETVTEEGTEGYYQNVIQRKYGLLSDSASPLVIADKEAVIGYTDQAEKDRIFGPERECFLGVKKALQSKNPKEFGQPNEKGILGDELDLIALDKEGYIHLMELKRGSNVSGIYMSPFQIGLYHRLFNKIDRQELKRSIRSMIEQKQRLGLIDPDWKIPEIQDRIIPELIICHRNERSSCYPEKYNRVIEYIRDNDPKIYEDVRNIEVKDENMNRI